MAFSSEAGFGQPISTANVGLNLVTKPATEPVSLTEAKAHIREDSTDSDAYISLLITAAREWGESFTRRAFIDQTWDLFLDRFPFNNQCIEIPLGTLKSVTTVQYNQSSDGVLTTMPASDYIVDPNRPKGRIALAFDSIWPDTRHQINAVVIRFVAGFGGSVDDVPGEIKHGIKLMVAHFFENREQTVTGTIVTPIPFQAERAFRHWKVF